VGTLLLGNGERPVPSDTLDWEGLRQPSTSDTYLEYLTPTELTAIDADLVATAADLAGGRPPHDAALADALIEQGACVLEFVQSRQSYRIAAEVRTLKSGHAAREAAIWHNRLFNPALPDNVHVLEFRPDWLSVEADPAPARRTSRSV